MVELTPEMQAQLDEQAKHCPFCKMIRGEIPTKNVYDDQIMRGILDINPWIPGHVLLLPKKHFPIMPYLPSKLFKHFFGMMPQVIDALKKSMLTTGANVFIANGGVAGQQAQHFMVHILPREKGDNISTLFSFDKTLTNTEDAKFQQVNAMLAQNLPLMMKNHFSRNPAKWRTGHFLSPDYIQNITKEQQILYQDEKATCVVAKNPMSLGHVEIYSNEEEKDIEKLSFESSAHLFFVASFCATAVFEGLGAQGSNIILKSGFSDDNKGKLVIHILPRFQDDGLKVIPKIMSNKPNNDKIASKIKDAMFLAEHNAKKMEKTTPAKPEFMGEIKGINYDEIGKEKKNKTSNDKPKNPLEEIESSINSL